MRIRTGLKVLSTYCLAGLATSSGLEGCAAGSERELKRPNILLAISDDQSWPHAGAYGDASVRTDLVALSLGSL